MLKFSVRPLLQSRGVNASIKYLESLGFTHHSARHIFGEQMAQLNFTAIEKLCVALKCTPNDLLFYLPGKEAIPKDHPLLLLNMDRFRNEITEGMQQLNATELEYLKEQMRMLLERKKNEED